MAFLQHLKEVITKHTTVDPKLQVGEFFLGDKFFTNQPKAFVQVHLKDHLYCPWRPQSSGKVEWANGLLKHHLTKVVQTSALGPLQPQKHPKQARYHSF
jgi:hypothetical protein